MLPGGCLCSAADAIDAAAGSLDHADVATPGFHLFVDSAPARTATDGSPAAPIRD